MKTVLIIVFCCSILLPQGRADTISCFSCLPVFKDCADDFGDMDRCEITDGYCSKFIVGNSITRQCIPACTEGTVGGVSSYCCRSNLCNSGIETSSSTLIPLFTTVLLLVQERF